MSSNRSNNSKLPVATRTNNKRVTRSNTPIVIESSQEDEEVRVISSSSSSPSSVAIRPKKPRPNNSSESSSSSLSLHPLPQIGYSNPWVIAELKPFDAAWHELCEQKRTLIPANASLDNPALPSYYRLLHTQNIFQRAQQYAAQCFDESNKAGDSLKQDFYKMAMKFQSLSIELAKSYDNYLNEIYDPLFPTQANSSYLSSAAGEPSHKKIIKRLKSRFQLLQLQPATIDEFVVFTFEIGNANVKLNKLASSIQQLITEVTEKTQATRSSNPKEQSFYDDLLAYQQNFSALKNDKLRRMIMNLKYSDKKRFTRQEIQDLLSQYSLRTLSDTNTTFNSAQISQALEEKSAKQEPKKKKVEVIVHLPKKPRIGEFVPNEDLYNRTQTPSGSECALTQPLEGSNSQDNNPASSPTQWNLPANSFDYEEELNSRPKSPTF